MRVTSHPVEINSTFFYECFGNYSSKKLLSLEIIRLLGLGSDKGKWRLIDINRMCC